MASSNLAGPGSNPGGPAPSTNVAGRSGSVIWVRPSGPQRFESVFPTAPHDRDVSSAAGRSGSGYRLLSDRSRVRVPPGALSCSVSSVGRAVAGLHHHDRSSTIRTAPGRRASVLVTREEGDALHRAPTRPGQYSSVRLRAEAKRLSVERPEFTSGRSRVRVPARLTCGPVAQLQVAAWHSTTAAASCAAGRRRAGYRLGPRLLESAPARGKERGLAAPAR
jgi:hypothetical protein